MISGTKAFTSGEVLTANDVNQYLMRGVKVFSSTAVRDAAYGGAGEPVLEEGEAVFLSDTNTLQVYGGTADGWLSYPTTAKSGKVLQVVSTTKVDTFSTTSTTFVDVTGLSLSITPSATASKIMLFAHISWGNSADQALVFQFMRDSTAIGVGTAAGSRLPATTGTHLYGNTNALGNSAAMFLDSPSTSSATTYKLQMRVASGTGWVNKSAQDNDSTQTNYSRLASTITAFEVGA